MFPNQLLPYNKLTQNDTWIWSVGLANYPATSGYVLSYALKMTGEPVKHILANTDIDGISYKVSVSSTITTNYSVGKYKVQVYITSFDSERLSLGTLDLEVLPDLSLVSDDYDARSHAEKCLDNLNAVLFEGVSRETLENTFRDATLKFKTDKQLLDMRNRLKEEVDLEKGILPGRIVSRWI